MRFSTLLLVAAFAAPAVSAQNPKPGSGAAMSGTAAFVPPVNDNFAAATPITAAGQYLSSTVEATAQAGEPVPPTTCATGDSGQSVWFTFRSTDGTPVSLDTAGSLVAPPGPSGGFTDTVMTLYTGSSLTALTLIACNDDDPANTGTDYTSRISSQAVTAGTTYYVRVSSYVPGPSSNGEVRLAVTGNVSSPTAGEEGADAFGSRLSASPNPMTGAGRVSLTVGASQDVRVALFDALGREVRVLLSQPVAAGQRLDVPVTTAGLRSGLYVVRATGATVDLTRRVTVVR